MADIQSEDRLLAARKEKEDKVTVAKKEVAPKIKRKGSEKIRLERIPKTSLSGGNLTFSNKNK